MAVTIADTGIRVSVAANSQCFGQQAIVDVIRRLAIDLVSLVRTDLDRHHGLDPVSLRRAVHQQDVGRDQIRFVLEVARHDEAGQVRASRNVQKAISHRAGISDSLQQFNCLVFQLLDLDVARTHTQCRQTSTQTDRRYGRLTAGDVAVLRLLCLRLSNRSSVVVGIIVFNIQCHFCFFL